MPRELHPSLLMPPHITEDPRESCRRVSVIHTISDRSTAWRDPRANAEPVRIAMLLRHSSKYLSLRVRRPSAPHRTAGGDVDGLIAYRGI